MKLINYGVRALRKSGILQRINLDVPLRLTGRTTWVPMMRGTGIVHVLDFEPFMDQLINRLVPLFPGIFLDVGVNVAQTLIKAKNQWPELEYVGFEPNPACVRYSERVVHLNHFRNVRFVPAGLTDHDGEGTLTLWNGGEDDPTATLISEFRERKADQREVKVPLTRWSTAEKRFSIGKLGFVKIDVEGSELEVLIELKGRLRADRPITVVEVLPTWDPPIAERLARQRRIEALITQADLKLYRVHKSGLDVSLEPLREFGVHTDLTITDHLLVPTEREAEVCALFPVFVQSTASVAK